MHEIDRLTFITKLGVSISISGISSSLKVDSKLSFGRTSANVRCSVEDLGSSLFRFGLALAFQYPSASCDTIKAMERRDVVASI